MASPGGERDHTLSLRHPENPGKIMIEHALGKTLIYYSTDSHSALHNVETVQAGTISDVSKQLPNTNYPDSHTNNFYDNYRINLLSSPEQSLIPDPHHLLQPRAPPQMHH